MAEDSTVGTHPTHEQLAAAVSGDAAPEVIAEHLGTCARCREEADALARVLTALAQPIPLEDPPPLVWERLRAELEPSGAVELSVQELPVHDEQRSPTSSDELAERRSRRPLWRVAAVAASAGLVLGAGGAALLGGMLDEQEAPEPFSPPVAEMVGEAALVSTTEDDVQGTARMVVSEADGEQLLVSVSALPADGYYEVWLRDEAASRLISLGTVSSTTTTLPVPQGVDLSRFPIVDVSQEHFDGDPSHSGVTVAAGPMIVQDGDG